MWFDKKVPDTAMGLIGFPINALLDWPMGTISGYEFLMTPEVNVAMGNVLKTWGKFLGSPASVDCLNTETGWLSQDAQAQLAANTSDGSPATRSFSELFLCDPSAPYYEFAS